MKHTQQMDMATRISRIRRVLCKTEAQTSLIWTSSMPNANKKYTLLSSCFPGETRRKIFPNSSVCEREREQETKC